nr:YkgJ family cysteine cluster protein [Methanoregula sp.]
MAFTCRQCGTCCMNLGDYIVIDHQIGQFEFACESVSTGTQFVARIDEDKRELFCDHTFPDEHPHACRFLRPDGNLLRCTIHGDSPAQCKFYRCVIMRITDPAGNPLGTVTGTFNLHSDDTVLRTIWEHAEKIIPESLLDAEERRREYLTAHGYQVE